ncbi:MAG TPA: alpha/beta hydrolase [Acidimicrobiaceae bacterium]|nr:alpha/beta hydrolase [Acidimicrobiaceae bacterium]
MAVLHTHLFGDPSGDPLLAVHGITAHGGRFRRLATEALPQRRTVAPDLRGHGRSTPDGPWNVSQLVADLVDTSDAAGIGGPVDVVGHSYGGVIALALLAAHPDRVRRLVLLDPALLLAQATAQEAAAAAIADAGWGSVAEALAARQASNAPEAADAVAADLDEHLQLGADGRYRLRCHGPAVVTGWGEMTAPLPAKVVSRPTLLVAATGAPFVTPDVVAGLRGLLGDALEVVEIACGHMLYWERFDETAAVVASFLPA